MRIHLPCSGSAAFCRLIYSAPASSLPVPFPQGGFHRHFNYEIADNSGNCHDDGQLEQSSENHIK